MKYYDIWRIFFVMVIFQIAMAISLFLFIFYGVLYSREVGFVCMAIGMGFCVVLVIKLRKFFKGDMDGVNSGEKPWRSYDFRKKKDP